MEIGVGAAVSATGRTLQVGNTVPLFLTNLVTAPAPGVITVGSGPKQQYAVAPDGRFLMILPPKCAVLVCLDRP